MKHCMGRSFYITAKKLRSAEREGNETKKNHEKKKRNGTKSKVRQKKERGERSSRSEVKVSARADFLTTNK